jgi:hypothetical protein
VSATGEVYLLEGEKKMKKFVATIIAIVMMGIQSTPLQAQSYRRVVTFGMPYLESFQTTEHSEDEIYLIVSGSSASGKTFQYRFPSDSTHWDLNDGEGDPPVENQELIDITMDDGGVVELEVKVMEEDGGAVGQWIKLPSSIPNYVDTDDVIGVFSVRITNEKGDILPSFRAKDRVIEISDPKYYWTKCFVRMNGDGSSYSSLFSVIPK